MSGPTTHQNIAPTEVELKDLLDLHKKDIMLNFNCHHIGQVQDFNPAMQTATVTISYKKTYFILNTKTSEYEPVQRDYPIITEAPIIVVSGGGSSLTFPIRKGDECLVLFNDRNIDNWFESSGGGPVANSRLHAFSDALILVGLRSKPNVIKNYDMTRAVLRNGDTKVGVSSTKVLIANQSTTLNTLLQSLIAQIQAITVTTSGTPSTPPNNAAAIAAIGIQLGGLLE